MEMNEFEQKLVEKIRQGNIAPKPRWRFLLKDYVIWGAGTFSLLVGAAAVSVMMYLFKYNGWELQKSTNKSLWEFFLLTLPYFWILFLGLFILLLYYNLQHTKRGYRYPVWLIIALSISSSVFLGGIFFAAGVGEKIDDILGESAPFYSTVINRHLTFWFNPEEGRLTGIVAALGQQDFDIIDPSGEDWLILSTPETQIMRDIRINQPVDLVGRMLDKNRFQADIIRPAAPGRRFLMRMRVDLP